MPAESDPSDPSDPSKASDATHVRAARRKPSVDVTFDKVQAQLLRSCKPAVRKLARAARGRSDFRNELDQTRGHAGDCSGVVKHAEGRAAHSSFPVLRQRLAFSDALSFRAELCDARNLGRRTICDSEVPPVATAPVGMTKRAVARVCAQPCDRLPEYREEGVNSPHFH